MCDDEQPGFDDDLSIAEAAARYGVAPKTLTNRLRLAEISGYKVRGPHGREWRVSVAALESLGYRPRDTGGDPAEQPPDVARLEAIIRDLRRAVSYERKRADRADRELGEAAMEIGRLRAALRQQQRSQSERVIDLCEEILARRRAD